MRERRNTMTTLFENVVGANLARVKAIFNHRKASRWLEKATRKWEFCEDDDWKKFANLTKGKAILNDSKMWHWIAKQTRKLRRKVFEGEYFDYLNIPLADQPFCQRYVCQYAGDFCRRCPINWGDNEDCCGTPFHEWELCDDWERAAELADQNAKFLRKQ